MVFVTNGKVECSFFEHFHIVIEYFRFHRFGCCCFAAVVVVHKIKIYVRLQWMGGSFSKNGKNEHLQDPSVNVLLRHFDTILPATNYGVNYACYHGSGSVHNHSQALAIIVEPACGSHGGDGMILAQRLVLLSRVAHSVRKDLLVVLPSSACSGGESRVVRLQWRPDV